jgi:tRNA (guanine37-N1)-methyltransferase
MHLGIVTLFPGMFDAITEYGVTARAVKNGQLDIQCWNPRDFTEDKHRTVDDRPYGGGPGMVMMVEPLQRALRAARDSMGGDVKTIYLSPQGRKLDQKAVDMLAGEQNLILVAGRYEGIDERFVENEIDEEWSIGDYVLSGGELAAMVMIDTVARQIPGVLGHQLSAIEDSFAEGLLDCPHYTRPEVHNGQSVPDVLLSGNHKRIAEWRMQQSLGRTHERRPDLLGNIELDDKQKVLLDAYLNEKLNHA